MTHAMSIDIETYSDVDIKKAGLYRYAQSPAFDILLIAWALDAGPVQIIDLTLAPSAEGASAAYQSLMTFFTWLCRDDVTLHAYNAAFEHYCINTWLRRQGRPEIPLNRWRCTMAHGLYCGYTAGLAATGEVMGLPQDKRKLGVGSALIRKFCCPPRATARYAPGQPMTTALSPASPDAQAPSDSLTYVRKLIMNEPDKWRLFKTYCMQDVETEREIERRLARWPMPEREQRLWELTTAANIDGVGVDTELVDSAIALGEAEQARLTAEAREISGLQNPRSVRQLLQWLNDETDTEVADLRKTTVVELLNTGLNNDRAERMLQLRQRMSKTSTKKYDALRAAVCEDGRVRGMMFYYGANRTGRWAGRIVQPQNLPQNHLDSLDFARERVKARDTEMIELCWDSVPDTLSQLIRTAFIPGPGKQYAVADYSAIEARVVAWLAGETWVLDAFQAGQDIYCATAAQMFGVPVEKHGQNAHLRQRGKVATLALGYGGGESALVAMGALRMGIPEEDLPEIKQKWRRANPAICRLWRAYEDATLDTLRSGAENAVGCVRFRHEADPRTAQDFLTIELPTGRWLFYAHPFLAPAKNFPDRASLHYYSVNQGSKKWAPTDTWGGKLVENVTQAVARDCLAETLLRLKDRGLTAVFHVHDEVICEVDDPERLQEILDIMAEPLAWAPGLPLKGAGFSCDYYQK